MFTHPQEREFRDSVCQSTMLEDAILWIKDNLGPNDVFDEKAITDRCQTYSSPKDVFTDDQLTEWAEENGYVLAE